MPDAVLHHVAILEVRDALVGVVAAAASGIRPRHERPIGLECQAGLEREGRVLQFLAPLLWRPAIDQEHRHRTRAHGQAAQFRGTPDRAHRGDDLEAPAVGNRLRGFLSLVAHQAHDDRFLTFVAVPLDVRPGADFPRRVVAPPRGDPQLGRVLRHEHADPDGRWELAAAGGRSFVLVVVLVRSRGRLGQSQLPLRIVLVLLLFQRRGRRDEKAGEIPAGGWNVEDLL